jgi:hypothetical protein
VSLQSDEMLVLMNMSEEEIAGFHRAEVVRYVVRVPFRAANS